MKNLLPFWLKLCFPTLTRSFSVLSFILLLGVLILPFQELLAQEPVLKHAYSFDNGTANDAIGGAHGIMHGGKIIDGEYITYEQGQYIDLPAEKININRFNTLTLEAYLGAGNLNAYYTMFAYFGNSVGNVGTDYLFQSLSNGGHSATAISCKNTESPWAVCTNVFGAVVNDLKYHHMVSTFDNREIKFYIDGDLVNSNTIDKFPDNIIANLSNELAYLGKSGYLSDPTWYGIIDEFNIYEGVMDEASIRQSAFTYLAKKKEIPAHLKEVLSDVLKVPGYRPESGLSSIFIETFKQSKFLVYPTIIRTPDSTRWSVSSAQAFTESLKSDLKLDAAFNDEMLDPGKLEGRGQFEFFNHDMNSLSNAIREDGAKADYYVILEILFPPRQSEMLNVFGIHILLLDKDAENAFSFLLNAHHDYFSYNNLFTINADPENIEALLIKCSNVAVKALIKQIEYAENESIN